MGCMQTKRVYVWAASGPRLFHIQPSGQIVSQRELNCEALHQSILGHPKYHTIPREHRIRLWDLFDKPGECRPHHLCEAVYAYLRGEMEWQHLQVHFKEIFEE